MKLGDIISAIIVMSIVLFVSVIIVETILKALF